MPLVVISPAQGLDKSKRALNIVVLSEGFLAMRQDVFLAQVRRFDRVLRATSPFHRFPNLVTVSALFLPSTVSIANITDATRCDWRKPNAAGQVPGDDAPSPFATPFEALYCRRRDTTPAQAFIPRFLRGGTDKVKAAIAAEPALAGLDAAPLVLVDNTQAFGGGALDGIGWFSMQGDWVQVAIHELGHSAFRLADEYDNDGPARHAPTEPAEPNVTTRATRDALRVFWNFGPSKFSLIRWHDLMDPATPEPTSLPNVTCTPLAALSAQLAKPGVAPQTVGLFEGANYSPCGVFRPRLDCRMRHNVQDFCPVCEWAIGAKLARTQNLMRVDTRTAVPGPWTLLAFYHEDPSRSAVGADLGRLVFYAGTTGEYRVQAAGTLGDPPPPAVSAAGVRIDPFWTSLSAVDIGGLPHFIAHSLPLGRLAIYEVVDNAGKPRLDLRFDSGNNAVPWTHVTTFVGRGRAGMIAYQSSTGRIEISRLTAANLAPTPISSTALDPNNLWLPGYTIITTFTVDGVPHVLKHNASDGVVHVQSLDPPGAGPNTFISKPGHWSPGATAAIGYEADGRTFVHRMSLGTYEALDWVWPGGAGVETQMRRQSLDVTLALAVMRGKTASGFPPFGFHMVVAMDVLGGRVRMMSVG
jgi:IgA Peptidase M64